MLFLDHISVLICPTPLYRFIPPYLILKGLRALYLIPKDLAKHSLLRGVDNNDFVKPGAPANW